MLIIDGYTNTASHYGETGVFFYSVQYLIPIKRKASWKLCLGWKCILDDWKNEQKVYSDAIWRNEKLKKSFIKNGTHNFI